MPAGLTVDDVVVTAERALDLRREFVGVDHPVPVLDGQLVPYVNLDNAASTPALRPVVEPLLFDLGLPGLGDREPRAPELSG